METDKNYRLRVITEYKEAILPLLKYLSWLEQKAGQAASQTYSGAELGEGTMRFPVYDSTLLSFVKDATKSPLMDKNYRYIYSRHHIRTHEDERRIIKKAGWKEWDILKGILSKYVLGGRVKGTLWSEAVQENIFYFILSQMKEIVEFWDTPIEL